MGRSKILYSQTRNIIMSVTGQSVKYTIPLCIEKDQVTDFVKCEKRENEIILHFNKKETIPVQKEASFHVEFE